jgi:hypothetical protein
MTKKNRPIKKKTGCPGRAGERTRDLLILFISSFHITSPLSHSRSPTANILKKGVFPETS